MPRRPPIAVLVPAAAGLDGVDAGASRLDLGGRLAVAQFDEHVDGRLVIVYAGARAGDSAQGVVMVVALERGDTARFSQHALATPRSSPYERRPGATFTLNVTARRFL